MITFSATGQRKIIGFIVGCGFVFFCISPAVPAAHGSPSNTALHISTWGADSNDAVWSQALLISGSRIGCSAPPQACLADVKTLEALPSIKHISVAFALSADTAADFAAQFSYLSRADQTLDVISIDDFRAQYERLPFVDRADLLRRVIAGAKSSNPNLAFGITLYTEELNLPLLRYPYLPDDVRNEVDYVYLYVANREDGTEFARDVDTTKRLFPRARIIGGVYAVDRIDYAPCANHGHVACTEQEEISLFKRTLAIQVGLIRSGELFGLEFYPGYFGHEEHWPGWLDARGCNAARRVECVQNTKAMRAIARQAIFTAARH